MSGNSQDEQHTLQGNGNESRVRYVEGLAHAEDSWVSITDAARITRTSEAMARRWVTSGRLPMKRQPVGINQHTRLVRLSDVAAIRPIIDPTAAISDEVHMLDLPSIPRQQAQIMRDHERLLQQVLEGHRAIEELGVHVRTQAHALEESKQVLREQEQRLQQQIEQVRMELTEQLKTAETIVQHLHLAMQDALSRHTQSLQQYMECLRHDLTTSQQQHDEQVQHTLQDFEETLSQQQQEYEHLRHDLTTQQQESMEYQKAIMLFVEQELEATKTSVEQQVSDQRRDVVAYTQHLERIEQRVEQVELQGKDAHKMVRETQRCVIDWDRQQQTITKMLQSEKKERRKLSEQLLQQQRQTQALRREVDTLKRQWAKP